MAHEVVVEKELLTENVTKVRLGQELIEMRLVQPHQLVLDILQNGTDGSQREDIATLLLLNGLVGHLILSEVG